MLKLNVSLKEQNVSFRSVETKDKKGLSSLKEYIHNSPQGCMYFIVYLLDWSRLKNRFKKLMFYQWFKLAKTCF